jgi:hypothetical protein
MAAQEGATSSRALIEGRLALCTEALRAADAALSRLSLEAVTSGDDTEALAAQDHLRQLENQHGLLVAALVECERQEQERQKAFVAQQNVTAKRSLAQHSSRFARDAADVAKAISDLKDATARLQSSGASIIAVLPNHLRTGASPFHELLSADGIAKAIAVEQFRLQPSGQKPRPGWEYENRRTGRITPMTDRLAALVAQVREDWDCAPPTKPPLPVSSPSASSPPADSGNDAGPLPPSLPAGVDQPQTHSGALGHQGRLTGVAVNASTGELVEMTEPFAAPLPTGSDAEGQEGPVRSLTVDNQGDNAPATGKALTTTEGVDFTPLFHGGQQ